MGQARQTTQRRQLGLMLKALRARAGRSQVDAAQVIGKSDTQVSHIENGRSLITIEDLGRLLDLYGVHGAERETALAMGAASRKRQPRRAYVDLLPGSFQRLADLQADAVEINGYEPSVVPGLLQSPDYVRALIRAADGVWWDSSSDETEHRISFRLEQQRRVLNPETSKKLSFVLTEETLHYVVGSLSIMRGQLLHLLQLMESKPDLDIRIVRTGMPNNPALGGGILVLHFSTGPRIGFATALYGPSIYYDQPEDTEPMLRGFHKVQELALTQDASRSLLISKLKES